MVYARGARFFSHYMKTLCTLDGIMRAMRAESQKGNMHTEVLYACRGLIWAYQGTIYYKKYVNGRSRVKKSSRAHYALWKNMT